MTGPISAPRVLHVGFTDLGPSNSAAATLHRAFGGYPEDRILQMVLRPIGPETLSATARGQARTDLALSRLRARSVAPSAPGVAQGVGGKSIIARLRYALSTLSDLRPVTIPRSSIAAIERFQPEVIHCPVWGVRSIRLVVAVATRLKIPVVPHFMDDWPSTAYRSGALTRPARAMLRADLAKLLAHSPRLLVIGAAMASEYSRRYERPCTVVGPCLTPEERRASAAVADHSSGLTYIGGLTNHRWRAIEAVAAALPPGVPLRMHVPAVDTDQLLAIMGRHSNVLCAGSLAPEQAASAAASCGALLFVETDEEPLSTYTRLSVSGKVASYLFAGRPVLAVGPPNQASIQELGLSPLTVTAQPREELTSHVASVLKFASRPTDLPADYMDHLVDRFGCRANQRRLERTLAAAAASRA
jgi:hypothetical protein